MITEQNPKPVDSSTYDEAWCEEMGGAGSNELFLDSQGQALRPRLAYALQLAQLTPDMAILDIGSGRGEVVLRSALAEVDLAVGVDYADASIQAARDNANKLFQTRSNLVDRCAFIRSDAKQLPFAAESFDRVLMLDIVEHLYEWELQAVWAEVKRVLKPSGLLVIHTLPNRWAMDYGYRLARLILPKLPNSPPDKRDLFHINEQSPPDLAKSLSKASLAHRVWLQDQILPQADWLNQASLTTEQHTGMVYKLLRRPVFRLLYKLVCFTPLRLLILTDLFAVAWKQEASPGQGRNVTRNNWPAFRLETLMTRISGLWQ